MVTDIHGFYTLHIISKIKKKPLEFHPDMKRVIFTTSTDLVSLDVVGWLACNQWRNT